MSQAPISTYFTSRKRAAGSDIIQNAKKVVILDNNGTKRTLKKTTNASRQIKHIEPTPPSKNLVSFIRKGLLSPNKITQQDASKAKEKTPKKTEPIAEPKEIYKTPQKAEASTSKVPEAIKTLDDARRKILKHEKVHDFRSRVQKLKDELNSLKEKSTPSTTSSAPAPDPIEKKVAPTLKKFETVQIEVLR